MALFHAEIAVVLRGDAIFALVDTLDAAMASAALSADRLVGAAASGMAEALAVVALPAPGSRRCRRRDGGPRSLARLALCLAGVLGPPTPLAAPRCLPAVFP